MAVVPLFRRARSEALRAAQAYRLRITGLTTLARLVAAVSLITEPAAAAESDANVRARQRMVANIEQLAAAGALRPPRRLDPRVLAVMRDVPRHSFVSKAQQHQAYRDTPLGIGHGSTISQPFMVAWMTDLAAVKPGDKVLEVGTGSGYQAAILAALGAEVYSVEIVPELAASAAARLRELGFGAVNVRAGDGYQGWAEHAPFDAILVTAGATHIPKPLLTQLRPTGRMVIPTGSGLDQQLMIVTKDRAGATKVSRLGRVLFVPLHEPRAGAR